MDKATRPLAPDGVQLGANGEKALPPEVVIDYFYKELARYSDKTFAMGQSTVTIMSAEALVLTAGLLAYRYYPLAFCLVPISWTVWIFQSLVHDCDTLKLAAYVRWLEGEVETRSRVAFARWERDVTARQGGFRGFIYISTYVLYALVDTGGWAFATWIVLSQLGIVPAGLFAALFAAHWTVIAVYWRGRSGLGRRYEKALTLASASQSSAS